MSRKSKRRGRVYAKAQHKKNVERFGNDIAIVILLILLVIGVLWFIKEPGFEPLFTGISVIGTIVGLATAYLYHKKRLAVGILFGVVIISSIGIYRSFTAPEKVDAQQVIVNSFNDNSQQTATYFNAPEFTSDDVQRILDDGHEARSSWNFKIALTYYEVARDKAIEIGDEAGLAIALINIGSIHLLNKEYSLAEENYEQAIFLSNKGGYDEIKAEASQSMGSLYFEREIFSLAASYYRQAEELYHELGNRNAEARMARNYGLALFKDIEGASFPYAFEQYQRALDIFIELNNQRETAITLAFIGRFYAEYDSIASNHELFADSYQPSEENMGKAVEYYQESLETSRQIVRDISKGTNIMNDGFGTIYTEYNDNPGLSVLEEASILESMGDVYMTMEKLSEARQAYNEALGLLYSGKDNMGIDGGVWLEGQRERLLDKIDQTQPNGS